MTKIVEIYVFLCYYNFINYGRRRYKGNRYYCIRCFLIITVVIVARQVSEVTHIPTYIKSQNNKISSAAIITSEEIQAKETSVKYLI